MIEIVKPKTSKNKVKVDPYYELTFDYMIGDSNGYTTEEMRIPIEDADIVEKFVSAISKLKSTKGHWGVMLEDDRMDAHLEEGQITQEEFDFLIKVMFWNEHSTVEYDKDDEEVGYFADCVRAMTEYSFLIFQGVDLEYFDEFGKKHQTKVN